MIFGYSKKTNQTLFRGGGQIDPKYRKVPNVTLLFDCKLAKLTNWIKLDFHPVELGLDRRKPLLFLKK